MIKKSFQKYCYFLLILFLFLMITFCNTSRTKKRKSADQICSCRMKGKIIGGKETKKNEFPWHVGLVHASYNLNMCGGVLINHLYVISAAHCFNQYTCEEFDILVGAHDLVSLSPESKRINTEKCILHPEYDSDTNVNDISLIKLAEYVVHDGTKSPACFPRIGTNYTGRAATIIGWGRTIEDTVSYSTVLLKTNVTIADYNECMKKYGNETVDPSLICTTWGVEGKGICLGDSGGPLMIFGKRNKHYVIGITSFVIACGQGEADFFTRVDRYYRWIQEYTGNDGICSGFNV